MSDTPLEALDAAIEQFLRDTNQLDNGTFLTGWTIGVATSRIQAEDSDALPMVSGSSYSIGPQTSVGQFAGLAKYLEVVAEKAIWQQLSNDVED